LLAYVITLYLLVLVDCGEPPTMPGGIYSFHSTIATSIAALRCVYPYVLTGNSNYTCSSKTMSWIGVGTCGK